MACYISKDNEFDRDNVSQNHIFLESLTKTTLQTPRPRHEPEPKANVFHDVASYIVSTLISRLGSDDQYTNVSPLNLAMKLIPHLTAGEFGIVQGNLHNRQRSEIEDQSTAIAGAGERAIADLTRETSFADFADMLSCTSVLSSANSIGSCMDDESSRKYRYELPRLRLKRHSSNGLAKRTNGVLYKATKNNNESNDSAQEHFVVLGELMDMSVRNQAMLERLTKSKLQPHSLNKTYYWSKEGKLFRGSKSSEMRYNSCTPTYVTSSCQSNYLSMRKCLANNMDVPENLFSVKSIKTNKNVIKYSKHLPVSDINLSVLCDNETMKQRFFVNKSVVTAKSINLESCLTAIKCQENIGKYYKGTYSYIREYKAINNSVSHRNKYTSVPTAGKTVFFHKTDKKLIKLSKPCRNNHFVPNINRRSITLRCKGVKLLQRSSDVPLMNESTLNLKSKAEMVDVYALKEDTEGLRNDIRDEVLITHPPSNKFTIDIFLPKLS